MGYAIIYKVGEENEIVQITNNNIGDGAFDVTGDLRYQNATDEADMKTQATAIEAGWEARFDVTYIRKNA